MTYTEEQLEAVQHAVERVAANWDGATTETVEDALGKALAESGVDVASSDVHALARAIEANHGNVTASSVLGG